jgi:hypothetical protein
VFELVMIDHGLSGPRTHGGPFRIEVWRGEADGGFHRFHAGDGPFFVETLGAWISVVDEGRTLRIADKHDGASRALEAELRKQ